MGNVLSDDKRELLIGWLKERAAGGEGLRAGATDGWGVGSKTGSGRFGTSNQIDGLWPLNSADQNPVLPAVYFTGFEENTPVNKAVTADVPKLVLNNLY